MAALGAYVYQLVSRYRFARISHYLVMRTSSSTTVVAVAL